LPSTQVRVAERLVPRPTERSPNRGAMLPEEPVVHSSRRGSGECADDRQQRGLARPVRAAEDGHRSARENAGYAGKRPDGSVRFADVPELHDNHRAMFASPTDPSKRTGPQVRRLSAVRQARCVVRMLLWAI
jgi:hypothetical protein